MAMLAGALAAPLVIGKMFDEFSSYAVIVNLEVTNRTDRMLVLNDFGMEDGVSEVPPQNIGPNEKLLFAGRKANWSLYGCKGKVEWKYGNTEIFLRWNTQYKTAVTPIVGNYLTLRLDRDGEYWKKEIEGDQMAKVSDGVITATATISDSNHCTIKVEVFCE